MKAALLFDLDGTLWDSTWQLMAPWNVVMEEAGFSRRLTHEELCACMGKTSDGIAKELFPTLPLLEGRKLVLRCCEIEIDYLLKSGGTLYPRVKETLAQLKEQFFLAIVSNCLDGYIQAFLTAHDCWPLFDDFQFLDRPDGNKAENIRRLMQRNKLERALYIGDTQGDYEAAQKAKIPFLHASYGFGAIAEPLPRLERFEDLPKLVEKLLK